MTEILILDYDRHDQLLSLLKSISLRARFPKKVVVLNNGGQKYSQKILDLCDEVIHNEINIGCGAGTIQLFSQCKAEYAFYIQVDHFLNSEIHQSDINRFISWIQQDGFAYIDLAGDQGHGKYSERAQFIARSRYLLIPKTFFGPGPLDKDPWTEECIQKHFEATGEKFLSIRNQQGVPPFLDCGKDSVRLNPDGSKWLHYPDTKVLFCLNPPTQKYKFPPLNDNEWQLAINGDWPKDGKIPEAWSGLSFEVWNKKSI